MKRFVCVALLAVGLGVSMPARADLVDNGRGLVYDSDLDVTWYADPSNTPSTWYSANEWAAGLKMGGVTGWRLPRMGGAPSGSADKGEMGHLYSVELHNAVGKGLVNKGPLADLKAVFYWSSTDYAGDASLAWLFSFDDGLQHVGLKSDMILHKLAVHSGNVHP